VKPQTTALGVAAVAALLTAFAPGTAFVSPAAAATPPPTPPPINAAPPAAPAATASPAASSATSAPIPFPSGFGGYPSSGHAASASGATPSPPPDARKGIDGVWEVAIQRGDKTEYTHVNLTQQGAALTGTYLDAAGKKFPLAGTLDGQTVRIVVSLADANTIVLDGKLDGTTDMIGTFTTPKERVYFSAAYRPKEKWLENVNPAPGGIGGAGGGYNPP
jgi:hypothetical protein